MGRFQERKTWKGSNEYLIPPKFTKFRKNFS